MIGVDIEDNSRFIGKDESFYSRIFTKEEIKYCISKSDPAPHFCARFCAKEAVIKALSQKGIKLSRYNEIEIYLGKLNEPHVRFLNDKYSHLCVEVSLSHDHTKSVAVAQLIEKCPNI